MGDHAIVLASNMESAKRLTAWDGSTPVELAVSLTISPASKVTAGGGGVSEAPLCVCTCVYVCVCVCTCVCESV